MLFKSNGALLNIENHIQLNPLISVFALLTPIKEILVKQPNLKAIDIELSREEKKITMIMKSKDLIISEFEFSRPNLNRTQLEVEIV